MTSMDPERQLWAEDITVGAAFDLGEYTVTRAEILEFAGHWDPQAIHLDDSFASEHEFGEIIASGIHTFAVYQRLAVLGAYRYWAMIAGRAIRDVQITYPVRAGATLRGRIEVEGVAMSSDVRALITTRGSLFVQDRLALELVADAYVRRRPATGPVTASSTAPETPVR